MIITPFQKSKVIPLNIEEIFSQLHRIDLERMCEKLFGINYGALSKVIYPHPKYKTFLIKKRNGDPRILAEPRSVLKNIQQKLLTYLYEVAGPMKSCVHGFTKNRSVVTNARKHCSPKTRYVLNIDLENFFPSITFFRVRGLFQSRPFDFSFENATVLAHLCCHNGKLPQGAPTSPLLANLICRSLDKELMALAYRNRATYTRYCDDMTFSFSVKQAEKLPGGICSFDGSTAVLGAELRTCIEKSGFSVNSKKTRVSSSMHRMEVTGLTINKFPNVKREFVDRIRGALHSWGKFGYAAAEDMWQAKPYARQNRISLTPPLHRVIWGRLLYLKMVRGAEDSIYTRLAERFNILLSAQMSINSEFKGELLPVLPVVRNAFDASNALFVVDCFADHKASGEVVLSQGTAFAFGDYGLVTCDHVIRYEKPAQTPDKKWTDDGADQYFDYLPDASIFIVEPSTGNRWPFKVVLRDQGRDLALLKFTGAAPANLRHFAPLEAAMELHQKGHLLGFPNWAPARKVHNDVECVVTSKFPRSALNRIEVNAPVRKGNSGGPLVDNLFRVAGVAQLGATQADGNDECLCITEVEEWIKVALAALAESPPKVVP